MWKTLPDMPKDATQTTIGRFLSPGCSILQAVFHILLYLLDALLNNSGKSLQVIDNLRTEGTLEVIFFQFENVQGDLSAFFSREVLYGRLQLREFHQRSSSEVSLSPVARLCAGSDLMEYRIRHREIQGRE
jgi:hypothetical protein